ncbi:hypothetical protein BLNAU_17750 [Blattamonas nauphoetae]|uniref:Uncharacterized protein n=1 Tax=Blattamonas nauphoetae TaxID=2049346 RepID=A0ABQ9X8S4_9EUKA|nr:hypothetical protein BLNAU_17750 [Blattamonas nauphoetae]
MSEQPHLEDGEISLSTSVPSDWRLILQDSITIEDLRQGCLSLFDQIDSALNLSKSEVNHAIRFLNYACMHIERRESPHNKLLETIFPEEEHRTTRLIWSLINLLSLPSDTLRTAAIFFADVGLRNSSKVFTIEIALTGLLPKLFLVLKPHEIPLNDKTIEFHRHLTSIVDTFFNSVSPEDIKYRLGETSRTSDAIESFYQSLCSYLQYLVDSPVSLPDHRSGSTFLLNTRLFSPSNIKNHCESSSPTVERFFGEIRKKMMDELDSLFGSASARNVEHFIRSGRLEESDIPSWVTAFESLLGRVSEGNKISDFAVDEVTDFISRFPSLLKIFFSSDDSFCLTKHNTIVSSSKLDSQALWTLFIPSQPHHAAAYLTAFSKFVTTLDSVTDRIHVWNEWFPRFIHTVDPSKQPFTFEFTKLHTTLIKLLDDRFKRIRYLRWARRWPLMEKLHSELDELHLAFSKQTKDYIVHLSLHPFALDSQGQDVILDFLREEYFLPSTNRQTRHFHEEVRREMDESELSSSSPPFILTSELVLCHTSDEIISIVDRIVALLASDSPLDDDTILRIFAFHRKALSQVYLPELFRAAGRSTEQYFHALESLLTFHVNCSPQTPIDNLLSTRPDKHEPTLDEWDDVDLETGLILMRVLNQNTLSLTSDSLNPTNSSSTISSDVCLKLESAPLGIRSHN